MLIHTPDLHVLIMERADKAGFWQSVTGSIEADETPYQAALREVKEETGLDALDYDFQDWHASNVYEIYPHWRHRYAPGVTQNREHLFSLQLPSPLPVKLAPKEHTRYEWLDWREAAKCVFSWTNVDALKRLGENHQRKLFEENTPLRFMPFSPDKLDEYASWFSDAELSSRIEPPTPVWLNYVCHQPNVFAWFVEENHALVGFIQLDILAKSRVGVFYIVVKPQLRGLGLGRILIKALIAQPEVRGLKTLEANVKLDNISAQRCLLGTGFTQQTCLPDSDGYLKFVYSQLNAQ